MWDENESQATGHERLARYHLLMAGVICELVADKEILTKEELLVRIEKLKRITKITIQNTH
jgi:hypothetical protein